VSVRRLSLDERSDAKRADIVHRRSISVNPSQVPLGKRSAVLVADVAAGVPLIDRE
jgi:hypothetical protein